MTRPNAARLFVVAACTLLLQACVATYVPAPGEKLATIRTVGFGRPQLCKDGKFYWAPEAKGVADAISVPAGERLTVGAHLVSEGYQVINYCRPFLSFVPQAGQTYFMNSALDGVGRCVVELVREDPTSLNGLSLERSVSAPSCFKK
jgi:hypothetical protein